MKKIIQNIIFVLSILANKLKPKRNIVIVLYENFNLLDVISFYQPMLMLALKNYHIIFAAKRKGKVYSSHIQSLFANYDIKDINKVDVLFLPGGEKFHHTVSDNELINWIKNIEKKCNTIVGVDTGVLLLAKAGVLRDEQVSSRKDLTEALSELSIKNRNDNYSKSGKYYTGKGVSAAIEIAIDYISEKVNQQFAKVVELSIEYDPEPPFSFQDSLGKEYAIQRDIKGTIRNHKNQLLQRKTIAILLYEGFTMLDLTGPYQVFKELYSYGYEIKFVGKQKGRIRSDDMKTSLIAEYSFEEIEDAYILFIPGSFRAYHTMKDNKTIEWIKKIDKVSTYSTSVCSGSLLYAKAGLLINRKASTHWYAGKYLSDYKAIYHKKRYTKDEKYITGAGVTSGIDFALKFVGELESVELAKNIQRKIGYFPSSRFNNGSPEKCSKDVIKYASRIFQLVDKGYIKVKN